MQDDFSSQEATTISYVESVLQGKVVFLNVFTIPEGRKAEELVTLLEKATKEVMRYQQGFRSATIHVALAENRVMNYVIWDSAEDFKNMRKNPEAIAHMTEIAKIFTPDGQLYKAVSVISAAKVLR